MLVRRLDITRLRNISRASINSLGSVNIIHGPNGAGKTTILEALSLLSSGKSFRSHKLGPLIQEGQHSCVVYGEVLASGTYLPVGVERSRGLANNATIKIGGERARNAAELAEKLPLQVICADTFKLLEGAPAIRRQYLDWGVFHVEPAYFQLWKSARRCLKQRNILLRHGKIDQRQLAAWTDELAEFGEQIDHQRQCYIRELKPLFEDILSELVSIEGLSLSYNRGWDKEQELTEVLYKSLERDISQGFTSSGPHRADLRIRHHRLNAAETLSRGQQKLVICALRLAQGFLLSKITRKRCVYLVDDLPAELDRERRQSLCRLLERLDAQVFVTCVDPNDLKDCWSNEADITLFHVEQGVVSD